MKYIQVTSMLLQRLEHIPVDSSWAHRASGVRGSLIRVMEHLEIGQTMDLQRIEELHNLGFQILEEAAREKC